MVYQVLIMPVLLYGAECWTMRKKDERRFLTMEMSCLRRMLGVTRLDRIKNEKIRKRVNLPETVVEVIRKRRLTWFGHVSRMSGDRLPTRALHCYIPGRRSRGRPCKKFNLIVTIGLTGEQKEEEENIETTPVSMLTMTCRL